MPAATKTKQEEKKTSSPTKKKPVQFFSRAVTLRVTLAPARVVRDSATSLVDTEKSRKGDAVEFENHILDLDPNVKGPDVPNPYDESKDISPGKLNELRIEKLRNHERFNVNFWEHGNAPDEPEPRLKVQLDAIRDAAKAKDSAAAREVLDLEQQTHARAAVITAAQGVLDALGDDGPEEDSSSPQPSKT